MRVLYFGTPQLSAKCLQFLAEKGVEIVGVVTNPDKPRGRSSKKCYPDVKVHAQIIFENVPIFQPLNLLDQKFIGEITALQPDIGVVVAYGKILPKKVLEIPKLGCINLHMSLLPKYRGASPIQSAILHGDEESGVSVIEMTERMDEGDILYSKRIKLNLDSDREIVESQLVETGKDALLTVIQNFLYYDRVKVPQNCLGVSYVKKINIETAKIDWSKTAFEIKNQVRAFCPKPGAWTQVNIRGLKKRLKIFQIKIIKGSLETINSKKRWVIKHSNEPIEILEVQLEGKKKMTSKEFLLQFDRQPEIIINQ